MKGCCVTVDPGFLIAFDITLLYIILGPLLLFGVYVLFDRMARGSEKGVQQARKADGKMKDPALWLDRDVRDFSDF